MPWPLSQDYNEAVQSPESSFADPELRGGAVATNALGLPMPCSGNFADVYRFNCAASGRTWAVKCFTRQIPGLQERYQQISSHLEKGKPSFMVDFTFLDRGIQVRGDWFPIVKMQWVEGLTLNQYVKSHLDKPQVLDTLCQLWVKLATRLREANIAHCDLQHGNVLLVPGSKVGALHVRLVDYDGMCVPALTMLKSIEVGHPSYQHPQRLRQGIYNLEVDRFSHLVIYTALRSLVAGGPALWQRYDNGDNLLFCQEDFQAPTRSRLFYDLLKLEDPSVRSLAEQLIETVRKPLDQAPLLDQLVAKPAAPRSSAPAMAGMNKGVGQNRPGLSPFDLHTMTGPGAGIAHARRRTGLQRAPSSTRKWPVAMGVCVFGLLLAGLVGLLAGGVFRVQTKDGVLVVQVNEPNADVYVDGAKVTVTWAAGGKKAEIHVKPGTRQVSVKKDGFTVYGREVTLEDGGRQSLTAQLEKTPGGLAKARTPEPAEEGKSPRVQPPPVPDPVVKPQSPSEPDPVVKPQPPPVPDPVVTPQPAAVPDPVVKPQPPPVPDPVVKPQPLPVPDPVVKTPPQPAGFVPGAKVYLSDLQEFDYKGHRGFFKNGEAAVPGGIKVNGEKFPKGLWTHPPSEGYSSVKYRLDGLDAQTFEAKVAINDTVGRARSPLTFEVRGDDKVLWSSKPVRPSRQTQDCSVKVIGIHVLELRVTCPRLNGFAHAVWLDPYLLTTATTTTAPPPKPAPAAPFRWPADKLRAGQIAAPDLSGCKLIRDVDFARTKPDTEALILPIKGGYWVNSATNFTKFSLRDFACEIVARKTGESQAAWGVHLHRSVPDDPRGVTFKMTPPKGLEVFRTVTGTGAQGRGGQRYCTVKSHPAIRDLSEWNRLLCVFRGRRLEVYVNDRAVTNPIELDEGVTPSAVAYLRWSIGKAVGGQIEIQRLRVWDVQSLPSLEEQARKLADVAPKVGLVKPPPSAGRPTVMEGDWQIDGGWRNGVASLFRVD